MREYSTLILIPDDRTLWLRLPDGWPVGPATVIVRFEAAGPADESALGDGSPRDDGEDIEWWEEFEEEAEETVGR